MSEKKITGLHTFTGSIQTKDIPNPEEQDTSNTIKIVFGTMEKDGTVRDATPEEKEEYESWCK